MSVTLPVHARVMPIGPNTSDPDNFDPEADDWVAEVRPFGVELNLLSDNVYANAVDAAAQASAAASSVVTASAQASAAGASAVNSHNSEVAAHVSELAAAASAISAATLAAGVTASSTTSLAVGNGTQVFTVPAGKQFLTGVPMVSASAGAPANRMFGAVASYTGTTLTLTITQSEGSGTFADWSISPSGAKGGTGGTAGGQLTGALDEIKGSDLASAATIDPWSTGGNSMALTGNVTITGIANAPQAGARRTLIVKGAPTITAGAALIVKGGATALVAGDEVDIEAETTTQFLITVRRGDGSAAAPSNFRNIEVLTSSQTWVAKATGPHRITLQGASGSGGVAAAINNGGAAASGASQAGEVVKTFNAVAGNTYVLILGAPGAAVTTPSGTSNFAVPGNDAVDSTFVGSGVSLTSGGGKKGNATAVTSGTAVAAGAVGGSASGGDANYTGGGSGQASAIASSAAASGGGAMPYRGFSPSSGTATCTTAGRAAASGGAGVGGKSGNALSTSVQAASAGGGYAGASADATNTAGAAVGAGTNTAFVTAIAPLLLSGPGTVAEISTSTLSASLGGGSGAIATTNGSGFSTGASVMGGGTGGIASTNPAAAIGSGSGIYSSASGGVAASVNATTFSGSLTSGTGGAAFAIIESR